MYEEIPGMKDDISVQDNTETLVVNQNACYSPVMAIYEEILPAQSVKWKEVNSTHTELEENIAYNVIHPHHWNEQVNENGNP